MRPMEPAGSWTDFLFCRCVVVTLPSNCRHLTLIETTNSPRFRRNDGVTQSTKVVDKHVEILSAFDSACTNL